LKQKKTEEYDEACSQRDQAKKNMRRIGLACNITTLYAEARAEESVSASGWQALAVLVRSSV